MLQRLLHGWKYSLSLLLPKELIMMLLLTLKGFIAGSGRLLLFAGWWLMPVAAYASIFNPGNSFYGRHMLPLLSMITGTGLAEKVYLGLVVLISFMSILSVRASLEPKQGHYYWSNLPRLILFSVIFFLIPQFYAFPLFWFVAFSFFDQDHSLSGFVNSLIRGGELTILLLPAVAVLGGIHLGMFFGYKWLWSLTHYDERYFSYSIVKFYLSVLLQLLFITMMSVVYIRGKHAGISLLGKKKGR